MVTQKRNRDWVQDYFFLFVPKIQDEELLSSWLTRMAIEHQRNLATFKEDYKNMRASGEKLTMYYDEDLKSLAITDNKSEPIIVPISDYTLFDEHFYRYVDKRNSNIVKDKIERGVYVPFEVLAPAD